MAYFVLIFILDTSQTSDYSHVKKWNTQDENTSAPLLIFLILFILVVYVFDD